MRCQEALSELATASLRDMQPDSEVMQHCSGCPDCGPLATQLRDREYRAASLLNSLPPMSNPISVAERAGSLARRRRIGKVAVFVSGAALVLTIWTAVFLTGFGRQVMGIDHSGAPRLRTETIALKCLSPEQAADIINPYVRSHGSTYYIGSSGVAAITVRGTADELAKSHALIRQFESDPQASCHASFADKLRELQNVMGAAAAAEKAAEAAGKATERPEVPERREPIERPEPRERPEPSPPSNRR
ncbi:MAG: hypothetical protein ACJ79Q_03500 [Gemmatimonadaceae bacterium]|jgi:hypothetical protein